MVVLTVGVCATVATAGGAGPAAAAAVSGVSTGVVTTAASGAAATVGAVAGGAGAGGVVGAVSGTVAASLAGTSTVAGGLVGAGTGAAAAGAVGATSAGTAGVAAGGLLAGPVGWCILGTAIVGMNANQSYSVTYDCWKPLLHDASETPSQGMLLRDLAQDERIRSIYLCEEPTDADAMPKLLVENIWGEKFGISFFELPSGQTVAHAELRE